MKKIIFGIFAHPDDEAFGPCGTLLLETRAGTELHLITLTAGENGTNPDNDANLGDVRLEEWRKAGELLGASSMNHLGYVDGTLNNLAMIEVSERITQVIHKVLETASTNTEIEFMTLDLNGLTGHIDHIVAARAACKTFYSLKPTDERFSRIRFFCLTNTYYPTQNTNWIYMEAGRTPAEINETIDARGLKDEILRVMHAHHSQRSDAENQIATLGDDLGLNHFIVKN